MCPAHDCEFGGKVGEGVEAELGVFGGHGQGDGRLGVVVDDPWEHGFGVGRHFHGDGFWLEGFGGLHHGMGASWRVVPHPKNVFFFDHSFELVEDVLFGHWAITSSRRSHRSCQAFASAPLMAGFLARRRTTESQ